MYLIYVVSQNPYGIYDELKDIVVTSENVCLQVYNNQDAWRNIVDTAVSLFLKESMIRLRTYLIQKLRCLRKIVDTVVSLILMASMMR